MDVITLIYLVVFCIIQALADIFLVMHFKGDPFMWVKFKRWRNPNLNYGVQAVFQQGKQVLFQVQPLANPENRIEDKAAKLTWLVPSAEDVFTAEGAPLFFNSTLDVYPQQPKDGQGPAGSPVITPTTTEPKEVYRNPAKMYTFLEQQSQAADAAAEIKVKDKKEKPNKQLFWICLGIVLLCMGILYYEYTNAGTLTQLAAHLIPTATSSTPKLGGIIGP